MQEQWRKIQLYALWQESNLDPAIPVQRSNQLIYYSVQSPVQPQEGRAWERGWVQLSSS
jgi:hypothetical protein